MVRFIMSIALLCCVSAASAADKVKLSLNWVPEPEFGGIYAAKQTGAFEKHGLDVDIAPGGAGTPTWQLVANGQADYAVASADEVLIARKQGADVVAIFAIYQTCPQGLMVHQSLGLKNIDDIFSRGGVTLAVEPGLAYVAFLKKKFSFDNVKVVSYDGGIGNFLNDQNFAQQCFVTSEPLAAKKAGADPKVFLVADAGYNPYTAVIITRGDRVRDHADQVKAMVQSLRDGWRSYLDDPKAAIQMMNKLNPDMELDTFRAASEAQKPLIETEETKKSGLGSMTKERWETLGKQLVELKIIDAVPETGECFIEE
jgi:NitT/TauT family transport system substrate-binding protein